MTRLKMGSTGQVGSWEGGLVIPSEKRHLPIVATVHVFDQFLPILAELHRPRSITLSWGEYDMRGDQVNAYEEVEIRVDDWDGIRTSLHALEHRTALRVAPMSMFVNLDTLIASATDESWRECSATFQISMTPPWYEPPDAGVVYATYIDVWLSTTYGEDYRPTPNHDIAHRNRPRLKRFLEAFANVLGPSFRVGRSHLYPFAITSTGFDTIDELPPRGSGS